MMKIPCKKGYSILELVIVLLLISIVFIAGFRSLSDSIDREKFKQTMIEMEEMRKAITGDETLVENGRRVDFGYWGDHAAWPATLGDLAGSMVATNSSVIETDAWGNNYVISSSATEWSVTSYGADGAANGTGFNTDIVLALKRADYEKNWVAIFVHDARGTLLVPAVNDGTTLMDGHVYRILFQENAGSGTYTDLAWSSSESDLFQQNGGFYSGLTVNAGPCKITVYIADGTGSSSGTFRGNYNWQSELNENGASLSKEFVIYPTGDSGKPNVFYLKLPGVAYRGINEVS